MTREEAISISALFVSDSLERDSVSLAICKLADLLLKVERDTATRCAEIVDSTDTTMFILDTAVLRIRREFGLESAK